MALDRDAHCMGRIGSEVSDYLFVIPNTKFRHLTRPSRHDAALITRPGKSYHVTDNTEQNLERKSNGYTEDFVGMMGSFSEFFGVEFFTRDVLCRTSLIHSPALKRPATDLALG